MLYLFDTRNIVCVINSYDDLVDVMSKNGYSTRYVSEYNFGTNHIGRIDIYKKGYSNFFTAVDTKDELSSIIMIAKRLNMSNYTITYEYYTGNSKNVLLSKISGIKTFDALDYNDYKLESDGFKNYCSFYKTSMLNYKTVDNFIVYLKLFSSQ